MFWQKFSLRLKLGLGIISSYSLYTVYVIYQTNREIERREQDYKLNNDNIARFRPITVLGKYQNPFIEYEHETLFHFIVNQVSKLFNFRNNAPEAILAGDNIRENMPIYTPNLSLIFNNGYIKNDVDGDEQQPQQQAPQKLVLKALKEQHKNIPSLNHRILFTWLGQSCSFVQISGLSILTDPIFNDYIINKHLGPKRITKSPVQLEELPTPKLVLVSHNHPDHLETDSIKKLSNESSVWVIPKGIRKELNDNNIKADRIVEMNWWEKKDVSWVMNGNDGSTDNNSSKCKNKWEIVCLPAMHWSGKYLVDSNKLLWCSFLVVKDDKPVFLHLGDTGYNKNLFDTIGQMYLNKPIELIMAPIGQYKPITNKTRHMSPEEATVMMQDVNGRRMVGVHYGTFILSNEHYLEPKTRLKAAAQELGKQETVFAGEFGRTEIFEY